MASWLYFLRKVAALSTEGRERLEIGGASGHSHSGAGLSSDWGQAAIAKSATGLPSKRCPKLEPNLPLSLLGFMELLWCTDAAVARADDVG
jgi:hypothetical protein